MNYTGPKVRLSRKLGTDLTPKASKVSAKKPYPPGQHGNTKRRAKQSDYGRQLKEKQRLRYQYNVSERQMVNYYKASTGLTGNTGDILVQQLETRLDALVLRAGLARTIYAARQLVTHGHVNINGRKLNIPSYHVKLNDVIAIKEKTQKNDFVQDSVRTGNPPPYLELSKADFSAKLLYVPPLEEIPIICEVPLVVEYYSK
ncbi:30S ribosomal protein S4 [bacterium]|nr:30S ribosomal protein S4 [bacterium]